MEFETTKTRSNRVLNFTLSFILAITLLASAVPQFSAAAVTCKFKHKVLQGETLTYIANLYGVSWQKIADASNLLAPYALTAGQKLCIPEGNKPDDTTTTTLSKNATMDVVPGINKVLLAVENFPKKTAYFVRISPSSTNLSYRIGHFTTNKEGDFTGWFRVPPYTSRTTNMTLCVKNAWTDKVVCTRYNDIFTYIPGLAGRCSPKEGR